MDDVVEIFVLLHTSFFRCSLFIPVCESNCARFIVTSVNIRKVIFWTMGLINFLNCAALN